MTNRPAIKLDETDNVVTILEDANTGDTVTVANDELELLEDIPFGHKVSLINADTKETVRKYGEIIGITTQSVERGEWVHTHNCDSTRGKAEGQR